MKTAKTIIGVTGPIAAGKDEVCNILKAMGFLIIDADKIGHDVIKHGKPAWKNAVKAFGRDILTGKEIDRKKLGKLVFENRALLKKLNRMVHPYILSEVQRKIRASKSKHVVVNAAVIKEIGLERNVDAVWAVLAQKNIRIVRLIKKGVDRHKALRIINSQMKDSGYKRIADAVICNNGNLIDLRKRVNKLFSV